MSDENMTNPEVEVTPVETPVERELTQEEMPNTPTVPAAFPTGEGKPVGSATIVEMDTPTEVFPTQGDDTTATQ